MKDILERIEKELDNQPRPLYKGEVGKLSPILKRPLGAMTILVSALGLIFFLLFFIWNRETYNVLQYKPLVEGLTLVKPVDPTDVDESYIGQPIYFTGQLRSEGIVKDELFNYQTQGLGLRRVVQMYQKNQVGDIEDKDEEYEYQWLETIVDPGKFSEPWAEKPKVVNDFFQDVKSQTFWSEIKIGQFSVTGDQIKEVVEFKDADLDMNHFAKLPQQIIRDVKLWQDKFYLSGDPKKPKLGDVRFFFQVAEPVDVTVMATMTETNSLGSLNLAFSKISTIQTNDFFSQGFVPQPEQELSGELENDNIPFDPLFDISSDSLALRRIVEVYDVSPAGPANAPDQPLGVWRKVQEGKKLGELTSVNPQLLNNGQISEMTSETFWARYRLGDYVPTTEDVMDKLRFTQTELDLRHAQNMEKDLFQTFALSGDSYYTGDPDKPELGDVRVRYEVAKRQTVTIKGKYPLVEKEGKTASFLNIKETFRKGTHSYSDSVNRILNLDEWRMWIERALGIVFLMTLGFIFTSMCRMVGDWDMRFRILHAALRRGKGMILAMTMGAVVMGSAWAKLPPALVVAAVSLVALGLLWFWIMTVREGRPITEAD